MAYGRDPATTANEMLLTKRAYADFTGKKIPQKDVLLYQIRQSFKPGEITPEQAQRVNLKQMASTLNFLTERKLLDYGTLVDKQGNILYNPDR